MYIQRLITHPKCSSWFKPHRCRTYVHITYALILSALCLSIGCQSDSPIFLNAPTIHASDITSRNQHQASNTPPKKPTTPAPSPMRARPLENSETTLPSDHLPIGNTEARVMVEPPTPDANPYDATQDYGKKGPLLWTAPKNWQAKKPSNSFRLAEYLIPPPSAGATQSGSGLLSIFHFPGGGGGIQANIDRWIGQFSENTLPTQRSSKVQNGLKIWSVEVYGNYNPGTMGSGGPQEDYALLGAIVETVRGPFFFKLTGPKPTILAAKDAFDAFVASISPGQL